MANSIFNFLKPINNIKIIKNETIGEELIKTSVNLKNLLKKNNFIENKYVIIGVPDDRGVKANLGHPGADKGPSLFRSCFYNLYDNFIFDKNSYRNQNKNKISQNFVDVGDIILSDSIEETHENLAKVVEFFLKLNPKLIFVIGGGHDFSYGSYKGHVNAKKGQVIPIINFDAHLDLRPVIDNQINSGTAFHRIIQDFKNNIINGNALLEIGIQRERNPYSLYEFALQHNIKIIEYTALSNVWKVFNGEKGQAPLEHIRDHIDTCANLGFDRYNGSLHFSLCLDVFDQSIAPGTSASTPFGAQFRDLAPSFSFLAKFRACRVMDIAELCPARDTFEMTSRLCASLVYRMVILKEEYSNALR